MSEEGFIPFSAEAELPMSYVLLYVHSMYAHAQETVAVSITPICQRIEQIYGIKITEIQQDVTATLLDEKLSVLLRTSPGEAALKITRSFF